MATPPFLPQQGQSDYIQQLVARLTPAGAGQPITTTAPNVQPIQAPQREPLPTNRPQQPVGEFSSAGAANRQRAQNLTASVQNLASQITNKLQERKQRETQGVFNRYADSVKGIQDSQAQAQQAMQVIKQTQAELIQARQAGDPQAESAARQKMMEAQQMFSTAQESLRSNQTNLDDMFNGPKGEKHAKMIAKGYGIDDKNAGTPERQAAIASVRKNMGVGQTAANLISRMPQTAQLTPQARAQAQGVQAGIDPRAATQGQILDAITKISAQASRQGIELNKLIPSLENRGITAEKDEKGNYKRNPDGSLQFRDMTPEERGKNVVLNSQDELNKAKVDAQKVVTEAKANPNSPDNQAKIMNAQARVLSAQASVARAHATAGQAGGGDYKSIAKQLTDPKNLTTLQSVASMRAGERAKIFAEAQKIDPKFNPGLIERRVKFLDAYEDPKGRAATNRQAINNVIQHAGDLSELNQEYRRSDVRVLNTPVNKMKSQFGDEVYTKFQTTNGVLKDELSLYFAGGYAPSEGQKRMWDEIQSDTATPSQTEAFAKEVIGLGLRRADTFNSQFKAMMGYDDPNMITPTAKAAAEKLGLGDKVSKFGSGGQIGGDNGKSPTSAPSSQSTPAFSWDSHPEAK